MMIARLLAPALLSALLLAAPLAHAHSYRQGDIQIGHIWARATSAKAENGAAYVPLLNNGDAPDKLVEVSTPAADMAMIHESAVENGVATMRHLDALELEPHQPAAMRPGGKHIMLMGLKNPLKEGDKFPPHPALRKSGQHRGASHRA
ncbi:MAG: copper chaperone PCu(A)C [Alphaproteobacteria bacterium]